MHPTHAADESRDEDQLRVSDELSIPLSEIEFRYSTSGGPGGQHANRSATRVTVLFSVAEAQCLREDQRETLLRRLEPRLDSDGVLQVNSQDSRSQRRNREIALDRLGRILAEALREARPRKPTQPTRTSTRRRVEDKRRRGRLKREREKKDFDW